MPDINETLRHCQSWGKQTIAFTLSIRAQNDGQSLDDPKQVQHAANAMEKVTKQLWEQATTPDIPNMKVPLTFARLVLEWSSDHLKDK